MDLFTFPTSSELEQIAQTKIPRLTQDRDIFTIMPTRNVDSPVLLWEQKDSFLGLQQVRGLNGAPSRVKRTAAKRYLMEPGIYGEFEGVDELELTTRRKVGSYNEPIDITDLVMDAQDKLLERRLSRIEIIGWSLLTAGTFSVAAPAERGSTVLHTDTFPIATFTAAVSWATVATATPLADLRAVKLLHRGQSVSFGGDATAYMNLKTFNVLIMNSNTNDLYGRRTQGLGTINNQQSLSALLTGDDLPQLKIYDEFYLDDNGQTQMYIPDNKVVVVGKRPAGQTIAEYRYTRNVNNAGMGPGPYQTVVDRGGDGSGKQIPRSVEVHDGHNGGPVIYYPGAVVVMSV